MGTMHASTVVEHKETSRFPPKVIKFAANKSTLIWASLMRSKVVQYTFKDMDTFRSVDNKVKLVANVYGVVKSFIACVAAGMWTWWMQPKRRMDCFGRSSLLGRYYATSY
jgi:hypothetical protein